MGWKRLSFQNLTHVGRRSPNDSVQWNRWRAVVPALQAHWVLLGTWFSTASTEILKHSPVAKHELWISIFSGYLSFFLPSVWLFFLKGSVRCPNPKITVILSVPLGKIGVLWSLLPAVLCEVPEISRSKLALFSVALIVLFMTLLWWASVGWFF